MLPMNCCQYSLEQSTTEKEMNTIKEGFYHLPATLWRNLQIWISFSIHKYGLRVVGSIVEEIVLFGFITLFTSILFLDYIHHFVHRHILGSVGSTVLLGPFPILQWPWTFSPPHENRWKLLPWLTTERKTYISMCIAKERHQSVKWIGWFGTRRRQTIQSASWMQEAQSTQRGTTAHHWPIGDQSPLQMNVLDKISTKLSKQHPETQQGRRYDGQ